MVSFCFALAIKLSAAVTAPFIYPAAQTIGRTNAGLLKSQAGLARAGSMNPTLGPALQKITFLHVFAGVSIPRFYAIILGG